MGSGTPVFLHKTPYIHCRSVEVSPQPSIDSQLWSQMLWAGFLAIGNNECNQQSIRCRPQCNRGNKKCLTQQKCYILETRKTQYFIRYLMLYFPFQLILQLLLLGRTLNGLFSTLFSPLFFIIDPCRSKSSFSFLATYS